MAYKGSPDERDFELARSFGQTHSNKLTVDAKLDSLDRARKALSAASQRVNRELFDAHDLIHKLPEGERQAYFDRINAASGLGAVSLESTPGTVIPDNIMDFVD